MVLAVYKHAENNGFHGFTVGIEDDVTHKSIKVEEHIVTEPAGTTNCMFWGLGSDGTVGANKTQLKLLVNILTKMLKHTLLTTLKIIWCYSFSLEIR